MTAVDVPGTGGTVKVELHDALTLVRVGVDRIDAVADAVAAATGGVVVRAADAPSLANGVGRSGGGDDLVSAEAAVAAAESAVADARAALEVAERAYTSAQDALLDANRSVDREAQGAVSAAEARLEVAQAGAAAARRALVQAREASEQDAADRRARSEEDRRRLDALHDEKRTLEERRSQLLERLAELGPAPEPKPVEEALSGLRRLRSVKPKPSERATALAERWVAVNERLAALPAPPAPPEWLVTPALTALHEAREMLAKAESADADPPDPAKVEAVEKAHRELLDAEQRVMRKGSRLNRRKLEQAEEAERNALAALGVASYGDYLQRIPDADAASSDQRVAQARAALADAEAVWEELHGGAASPEYTAAKEEQAEIRSEALGLLGVDVDDADLEDRLRNHLETVVDSAWAEQQLTEALTARGVDLGDDLESAAEAWLAAVPAQLEARRAVDDELAGVDERLKEVDDVLTTHKVEVFFDGDNADDPFTELTRALEDAEAAEREAEAALAEARERLDASEQAASGAATREQEADAARTAVDEARARLAEAESALKAAQAASADATDAARAAEAAARPPAGIATEAWLLARLAAARASADAVVVDARVAAAPRALRLLERASTAGKVVVLGDEDALSEWAKGLGDRAAIRTI